MSVDARIPANSVEASNVEAGTGSRSAAVGDKPLRRDAERNRQLILEVAAQVFAEKGLDAGFDEIAKRAGVGAGTVYRRFPHRDQLIEALMTERLEVIADLARKATEHVDPWEGLVEFLITSIQMQIDDRGLRDLLESSGRWAECSVEPKSKLLPLVMRVIDRAKDAGQLRNDVEITDIGVLLTMISSIQDSLTPGLWKRYLMVFLDGLRVQRSEPTPLPFQAPADPFLTQYRGGDQALS